MKAYDLIAEAIEGVLAIPKPRIESASGLNALVRMPPVLPLLDGWLEGAMDDEGGMFLSFDDDENLGAMFEEVNVAIINPDDNIPGMLSFNWLRTATVAERRRCRRHSRQMLALTRGGFIDGRWIDLATEYVSWIGKRWIDAEGAKLAHGLNGSWGKHDGGAQEHDRVQSLLSVALSARYYYSMVLSDDPNNLSVRLHAYPSTLRYLLRTRELGNHQRRRALTHLVRAHARKRFKTHMVRNHLRGEHRCQWAGLDVRLLPSQYDAETSVPGALHERLQMDGMLRYV